MQYAKYGKNGPMISRLGFGLMRLPVRDQSDEGTVIFRRSTRLIRAALDAGVNFFDSHHNYHSGQSEVAFGKALKGWKGPRVYLQTKAPWYLPEPISYFKRKLEEALEKLGVESIDYLLFHSMQMKTWKRRGKSFIRFTDWALKHGFIRHRGFSSHETPENVRKFKRIVIAAKGSEPVMPCGACRQLLHDFAPGIEVIVIDTETDIQKTLSLEDLFPHPFGQSNLV